ncbi:MAG: hypothetical protein HQ569_09395, partial [Actinobacteria bacterium]|nr:hypothetical protein [Actinomycetota bacterium]
MLPEKKGIEKSLWVKKFIKRMDYSREGITLIFYYKGLKGTDHGISASGRAKENAGRNSKLNGSKKEPGILDFGSNNAVWL